MRDLDALCICPECRKTMALDECDCVGADVSWEELGMEGGPDQQFFTPCCAADPIVLPIQAAYDDGALPKDDAAKANQRTLF